MASPIPWAVLKIVVAVVTEGRECDCVLEVSNAEVSLFLESG